jgi:hypothetical protein
MAGNASPIYSRVGDIQWGTLLTTANTAVDGTGTVVTIFSADATNGGRVERIKVRAAGTNVATVLRIFINNGLTNATPANNSLFAELTCPATTLSQVAALLDPAAGILDFPLVLPPGYKVNCTIGTTIAAGIYVTALGGKY